MGQSLLDPLAARVTDIGGNPVAGVPVVFRVESGGGSFSGGDRVSVLTDADGTARATWTVGPETGINHHEALATFEGNPGLPAFYIVSGVAPGPLEDTTVSGIVADRVGRPVVGARVVLRDAGFKGTMGLEATTGPDGAFTLRGMPAGGHRLGILGSAADDAAQGDLFPDIDYAIQVTAGVNHRLDQVVVLPFLDVENTRVVGGDEDVTLTLAGVSGFSLKVLAGSVILPDGTRGETLMSSSGVKFNQLPLPPPHGTTPLVVSTLHPAGLRFDPPAVVTYPNAQGLAAGDVADVVVFQSDVGQFTSVGPATVSEDGSVVVSDPGFGIVQTGWHGVMRLPGPTTQVVSSSPPDAGAGGALERLDETWTVTVNGQTVQVNPDGTFRVPNVSTPDAFARGSFPGHLFGYSATGNILLLAEANPFPLTPGDTTFSDSVFPIDADGVVESIDILVSINQLSRGETVQLTTTATLGDGTQKDVTEETRYVATGTHGLAIVDGSAFIDPLVSGPLVPGSVDAAITAFNGGSVASTIITVIGAADDPENDGMPKDYEELFGLDPFLNDANGDLDNDGLSNIREFELGTLPNNPDTDGDGVPDGRDGNPLHPEESAPRAIITSPADGIQAIPDEIIPFQVDVFGVPETVILSTDTGFSETFVRTDEGQYTNREALFDNPIDFYQVTDDIGTIVTFTATATDSANNTTTATALVTVIPDPLTTVVGTVVRFDSTLGSFDVELLGADVPNSTHNFLDDITRFEIPDVPTHSPIRVEVRGESGGQTFVGRSGAVTPVRGGITDIGTIDIKIEPVNDPPVVIGNPSTFGGKLPLGDDEGIIVQLANPFRFYGQTNIIASVNSNGSITFGPPDPRFEADLSILTFLPRIAVFLVDLDPTAATDPNAGVYVQQLADAFMVTWYRLPVFGQGGENTFRAILRDDGSFDLVYGEITADGTGTGKDGALLDIVVGITPGGQFPDVREVDLLRTDTFVINEDQAAVQFFGGLDDFNFSDNSLSFTPLGDGYNLDAILGGDN